MNYYEALGVPRNASPEEIRHAYLAKAMRLHPDRYAGAPDYVIAAVTQSVVVIDAAWRTLGHASLRVAYDRELDRSDGARAAKDDEQRGRWRRGHAEHTWALERELGWPLSHIFGLSPPEPTTRPRATDEDNPRPHERTLLRRRARAVRPGLAKERSIPSQALLVSPLYDPLAGLEAIANWLAPTRRASRNVTVPDVCGLPASDAFYAVAKADLHINFVRLTENPAGVDGTVIDQDPAPGSSVRRHSTLTVRVVHPLARAAGAI